ncbi:hypothetical protein MtrunA17_Chr4g0072841 [Medicago truncatula]|uniref:Transmembrane protein n=1 Tax=Medicago truncatula TaxID=3880 RepID=A0A396ILP2_MEDTR|nr:hypothetical protein MtrunA17_Chr4g0072841 [Medicago truncatula]
MRFNLTNTMVSVHATYFSLLILISIQFIYRRFFFPFFQKKLVSPLFI